MLSRFDASSFDTMTRSTLSTRLDPESNFFTQQSWHINIGTQNCLGVGDWNTHRQVVAVTTEERTRTDMTDDKQIATRTSIATRCALTKETNTLAVGDSRGNTDLDFAIAFLNTCAPTSTTRRFNNVASSTTTRTW